MAKKKETPKFIDLSERLSAAMYFTMSNTATLDLMPKGLTIEQAYYHVDGIMEMECGVGLREELDSWKDMIKKGDNYCYEEWDKVKNTLSI
jgi:hypothetical protein